MRPPIRFFRPGGPIRPDVLIRPPRRAWVADPILSAPAPLFDSFTARTVPTGTSDSFTHVCGGSLRCLYVMVAFSDNPLSPVTCSYNGVGMTEIASQTAPYVHAFRLVNPAAGSNLVALAWPGARFGHAMAISLVGVDQADPDDAPVTELSGDESISVPSASRDLVLDMLAMFGAGSLTAGAGQTSRGTASSAAGAIFCSTEPGTDPSVTMSWTSTGNVVFHVGVNIRAPVVPQLGLMAQQSQRPLSGRTGAS